MTEDEITEYIDQQLAVIRDDLKRRKMTISCVVGMKDDGKQQAIGYRKDMMIGISQEYPVIQMYGRQFGVTTMYEIGGYFCSKALKSYKEQLPPTTKNEPKPKKGFKARIRKFWCG